MEIIELHYYLDDQSHSINAYVKNRAEAEIIRILKETADLLDINVDLEVEALEIGGIREFYRIFSKKKNRKVVLPILGYLLGILSGVLIEVISEKLKSDPEFEKLKKEEIILQIKKLKIDINAEQHEADSKEIKIKKVINLISNTPKIRTFKSNFYASILKEDKIDKISWTGLASNKDIILAEEIIYRNNFKDYIIDQILLAPEVIEDVTIEIVSPVLRSGNSKWKGLYDLSIINFNLLDKEFRKSVSNREISFSNGTQIKCDIEFKRIMDQSGEIKIVDINVSNISELIQGDVSVQTKKGKLSKKFQSQLDLFE